MNEPVLLELGLDDAGELRSRRPTTPLTFWSELLFLIHEPIAATYPLRFNSRRCG
jgi:hypothetical protein